MEKRRYRLKRMAARQHQTRARIVDAAMALHEELGPAATSISALAKQAGVQRLTVYRHFPNETEIFRACSSKWLSLHPPPDISSVRGEGSAGRTRSILQALYGYYQDTERMWTSIYRDYGKVPALDQPMQQFEAYLEEIKKVMLADRTAYKSKQLQATLGHVISFSTWKSLSGQGLRRAAIVDLVCGWIELTVGD